MTPVRDAYMLDTTALNDLCDGKLDQAWLTGRRLLITGVQADELRATSNAQRRAQLLEMVETIAPELMPAASFCLGIEGTGFGQGLWNDGSGRFDKMLSRLKQIDKKAKNEAQHRNQLRDVLIAETAIKLDATLVTRDGKLTQMVREFGGKVVAPADLRPTPEPGAAAAEPSPGG